MASGPDYDPADELADEARADTGRDEAHEFRPDWCIAPSELLAEWMADHGQTRAMLARGCGRGVADIKAALIIRDVLNREPLTAACAEMLEAGTGITAAYWLRFERSYRNGLAAGLTDVTSDA
jgi:plasmid maintenance system antidote protein VapI